LPALLSDTGIKARHATRIQFDDAYDTAATEFVRSGRFGIEPRLPQRRFREKNEKQAEEEKEECL